MESLILNHSLVLLSFSVCALLFYFFLTVFDSITNENDTLKSVVRFMMKQLVKFKNWLVRFVPKLPKKLLKLARYLVREHPKTTLLATSSLVVIVGVVVLVTITLG